MNILANENFPRLAVDGLRAAGHNVLWARTDMPGAADDAILSRAQSEARLVITFDKDLFPKKIVALTNDSSRELMTRDD